MRVDFTNETVFSFAGPNLCLLGNEEDFRKLAEVVADLTVLPAQSIELSGLEFAEYVGAEKRVVFSSKSGARKLGVLEENGNLVFELDTRYWERLFKYFVLMSWDKRTYYLNCYENCLDDLDLEQECNFICSSEY